jgi:hypothetical protein
VGPAPGDYLYVNLDLSNCKSGETLSWACCQTPDCELANCNGGDIEEELNKCDELTQVTFKVPVGVESLLVQVHDGKIAGDKPCTGGIGTDSTQDQCCGGYGGSCGTISGVCDKVIYIQDCPGAP